MIRSLLRLIEPTTIFAAGKNQYIQAIQPILMGHIENAYSFLLLYMIRSSKGSIRTLPTSRYCLQPKSFCSTEELGKNGALECQGLLCLCLPRMFKIKLCRFGNISHKRMVLCFQVKIRENFGRERNKETEEQPKSLTFWVFLIMKPVNALST